MAGRNYPRLTIEQFGEHLLESGDCDPIYIALYQQQMRDLWPDQQLFRWLLVYWCFYNAGLASHLCVFDGQEFWDKFMTASANHVSTPSPIGGGAVNGNWPRGKERRHFRGQQATKATRELAAKYPCPADAVRFLCNDRPFGGDPTPFSVISDRVQTWRGFGDWIAFKVGDMLERIGIFQVVFAQSDAMYKDPTQAALMQWRVWHGAPVDSTIDDEKAAVDEVVQRLITHFAHHKAQPVWRNCEGRAIGFQEVETILCKWKSHTRGHYPLNNDIHEITDGVAPWAKHSDIAAKFLECLPKAKV
jgi:hypothetical protein